MVYGIVVKQESSFKYPNKGIIGYSYSGMHASKLEGGRSAKKVTWVVHFGAVPDLTSVQKLPRVKSSFSKKSILHVMIRYYSFNGVVSGFVSILS